MRLQTLDEQRQSVTTTQLKLPNYKISDQYKGLKVLGLVADNSACGYYRVINPIHMLGMMGADVYYTSRHNFGDLFKYDIIIAPRQHSPEVYEVLRMIQWENKVVIFELDDDLHAVPPESPAYPVYHSGTRELTMIPKFISHMHGMTSSTEEIARWYYQFNKNQRVCKNLIDFSFRDWNCDVEWRDGQPIHHLKTIERPAEFEDYITVGWTGGSCYDDQTEVLTEEGFKLFKDLNKTEKIASLNPDTHLLEYVTPIAYTTQPFKGKLNCASNSAIDFAVTPNHWMYCSPAKSRTKKKIEYQSIQSENIHGQDFIVKKTANWNGKDQKYFTLASHQSSPDAKSEKPIPMLEWVRFLGLWMAEGYTCSELKQVGLVQIKAPELLEEMGAYLKSWGFNLSNDKRQHEIRVANKQLWEYLHPLGEAVNKRIPQEILDLTPELLKEFLNYYIKGDGSVDSYGRTRAWTSSKVLADQLVEIALKIGWAANVFTRPIKASKIEGREIKQTGPSYEVRFYRNGTTTKYTEPIVLAEHQTQRDYDGTVYCVTVPNHTLYVRRNGKAFWCKNTHQLDIPIMGPVFKYLLDHYDNVKIFLYCGVETVHQLLRDYRLDESRVMHMPARHFLDYPPGLRGLDIGIAPLHTNQFNLAKSDLKFLEMSAAGVCPVLSHVGPYAKLVRKFPGICPTVGSAPDSYNNWITPIVYLMENPEIRKQIVARNRQLVVDHFSLEKHVHQYPAAWKSIMEQASKGEAGPPKEILAPLNYKTFRRVPANGPCPCGSGKAKEGCCGPEAFG